MADSSTLDVDAVNNEIRREGATFVTVSLVLNDGKRGFWAMGALPTSVLSL